MGGKRADAGYFTEWRRYRTSQRMSFLRFLVYGWILGIPGWILFTLLYPLVWIYYSFYTFSFSNGSITTKEWRKFNIRRAFGAYINKDDLERIKRLQTDQNND